MRIECNRMMKKEGKFVKYEMEMRPALLPLPWNLDTDLNSKLCWPCNYSHVTYMANFHPVLYPHWEPSLTTGDIVKSSRTLNERAIQKLIELCRHCSTWNMILSWCLPHNQYTPLFADRSHFHMSLYWAVVGDETRAMAEVDTMTTLCFKKSNGSTAARITHKGILRESQTQTKAQIG